MKHRTHQSRGISLLYPKLYTTFLTPNSIRQSARGKRPRASPPENGVVHTPSPFRADPPRNPRFLSGTGGRAVPVRCRGRWAAAGTLSLSDDASPAVISVLLCGRLTPLQRLLGSNHWMLTQLKNGHRPRAPPEFSGLRLRISLRGPLG